LHAEITFIFVPREPIQPQLIGPEHPGKILRQRLDEKGWTQDALATITGISRTTISAIVAGRSGISAEMAVRLAGAFGNRATDWLKWDGDYQLSLVSTDHQTVGRMAQLHDLAPIREMQKRGWIKQTTDPAELEAELNAFYGGSIRDGISFTVATSRRVQLSDLNPAEKAWCFRARQLAAAVPVAVFSRDRLAGAERKLRQLAAYPKEVKRLPQMLAYYGIRFVVVEPLPGAKIDGAAFWIDDTPVIAVSVRWDRIDAFWFTVMHEFAHIKNDDVYSVDTNLIQENEKGAVVVVLAENETEQLANTAAADILVPQTELESFIRRLSPLYSAQRIVQFANRIQMHPGIIVGQLQYRGELGYSAHRNFLVKIRALITNAAITDGWGQSISPNIA
jgi:HTH-type transcriptional regulator / antitoxin HigA